MERMLVIGANGQIGSELVDMLAARHGAANVIAADIVPGVGSGDVRQEVLDVLEAEQLARAMDVHDFSRIYHLAALLSVKGEELPLKAWALNMNGLLNVLELARAHLRTGKALKVFWPSSIAAFGPHTPAVNTPQLTVMDPTTIYGISKQAGERLCEYYHSRYGVDVRSIRYPGIVSYKSPPGGGVTDYAIAMLQAARLRQSYRCFLRPDTRLPMIYMPDALRATVELMDAPGEAVHVRSAYNVAGMSFSPQELAEAVKRRVHDFEIVYAPDVRQGIADNWPRSLDDSHARADWGWQARIGLEDMVDDMLVHMPAKGAALLHGV